MWGKSRTIFVSDEFICAAGLKRVMKILKMEGFKMCQHIRKTYFNTMHITRYFQGFKMKEIKPGLNCDEYLKVII